MWMIVNEKWGGIQANGISVFYLCSRIRLENLLITEKLIVVLTYPYFLTKFAYYKRRYEGTAVCNSYTDDNLFVTRITTGKEMTSLLVTVDSSSLCRAA